MICSGPPRAPEDVITQRDMDLAASIQAVVEEIIIRLAKGVLKYTRSKNLCLAGGVALNCVANSALIREGIFDHVWIQPAAGDAGVQLELHSLVGMSDMAERGPPRNAAMV